MKSTKPTLFVFHETTSTGGCIPLLFEDMNLPFITARPRFGDHLPNINDVASVVFFGGASSVNCGENWIKTELGWMESALSANLPMFNICLGAQMLAKVLGSQVKRLAGNRIECGYYPLEVTCPESKLKDLHQVYHWHSEHFDLPKSARCLAKGSELCPIQAFDYENALAVQFHPEINTHCIRTWGSRDAHDLLKPNAHPLDDHFDQHAQFNAQNRAWLKGHILPWLTNN